MFKQEMQKTQNAKIISTLYVDERDSADTDYHRTGGENRNCF